MSAPVPTGQFRVELPDGYVVERLPLARAHDGWHLSFIGWHPDPGSQRPPRGVSRHRDPLDAALSVSGIGGRLGGVRGGGHGNDREQHRHLRVDAGTATAVLVVYSHDGVEVAREELPLS